MKDPEKLWLDLYQSYQRAIRIGRRSVAKGTAYLYRVGSVLFKAGFALYLSRPEDDWRSLVVEALDLYERSVAHDDCLGRDSYPFNLAKLYLDWYLGEWWLDRTPDPFRLDTAINLCVEGLWEEDQQLLSSLAILPQFYLLRQDRERLRKFWTMVAERTELVNLPAELELWRQWTMLFLEEGEPESDLAEKCWNAYSQYAAGVKDPSSVPAHFYLSVAKMSQGIYDMTESRTVLIRKFAVEPWKIST